MANMKKKYTATELVLSYMWYYLDFDQTQAQYK